MFLSLYVFREETPLIIPIAFVAVPSGTSLCLQNFIMVSLFVTSKKIYIQHTILFIGNKRSKPVSLQTEDSTQVFTGHELSFFKTQICVGDIVFLATSEPSKL